MIQEATPRPQRTTGIPIPTWDSGPGNTGEVVDRRATAHDHLLQRATDALRTDHGTHARTLLEGVVQADPHSEHGWLWLAEAVDMDEERRFCLQRVLAVNRRNALARRRLEALGPGPAESPLIRLAITALEAGHREEARHLLEQVIRADPRSEHGWLWLADTVDSAAERRFCLIQVLAINRRNALARRRLLALGPGPTCAPLEELASLPGIQTKTPSPRPSTVVVDRLRGIRQLLQAHSFPIAAGYLAVLTVAEALTTLIEPRSGLALHALLLLILIAHTALIWGQPGHRLLFALIFAPLIRIVSLFLPMAGFPLVYWYLIVSVPLFAAALVATRTLGLSGEDVGLKLKKLPLQVLVILTGLSLGYFEYWILRPAPLAQNFSLEGIWVPALILLICTGFAEELIFRGIMQRAASEQLGSLWGTVYVAALFAALHMGYQSFPDMLFVFIVALFFGLASAHTGSIVGVSLAHGLTNVILYLAMPFGVNPFDLASYYVMQP
jgi:membrane protease YdiL (CAAX protease family)